MKISVIGCGYLGAVHAASMAMLGHEVTGVDVSPNVVESLNQSKAPFFEPGLNELIHEGVQSGNLRFTSDYSLVSQADVHFITVGTPQKHGTQAAELSYVHSAYDSVLAHMKNGAVIIGKSTVPVGTAEKLSVDDRLLKKRGYIIWNPEFLREGFAIVDTVNPDRLVFGLPNGANKARAMQTIQTLFAPLLEKQIPTIYTNYSTAELVKSAANAFLATKISFINALSELTELSGGDITALSDAIGYDARIGRKFLNAGVGFGGGCLPKDIRAFQARAEELGAGISLNFLKEIDQINIRQRHRVINKVEDLIRPTIDQATIAVLGLSFKPNSDDIRDSPALYVATGLHEIGLNVVCTDPVTIEKARETHPELTYVSTPEEAVQNAEVVVLLTEWEEYRTLKPEQLAIYTGKSKPQIIDARNCLNPDEWRAAGWIYAGIGR